MRIPEPGQMPLAKPKSSLLAYDADKQEDGSSHFFNPNSRMHNASTISKRFEPGDVGQVKKSSRMKMKKVTVSEAGPPRASTRVRSSFFALFTGKKQNRATINGNGVIAAPTRKKKRTFLQRLFGFGRKKRKTKYRDDIIDARVEEKVETLDLTFNNEPIDPRQHMRNTQNFLLSRIDTLNGEDLNQSEAATTEIVPSNERDVNSVDLFEVDKARQSFKHDSLWEEFSPAAQSEKEDQPLAPHQRRDMISFVGSGKVKELEPAGRTTLKETSLPRQKKPRAASHLFLSNATDLEFSPPPLTRTGTLKGDDLPKTPFPQQRASRNSSNKKVDDKPMEESSVLTSSSFKRKVSRNNSVMSARNIELSVSGQVQAAPSEEGKSENITLQPTNQNQSSGIWSVDDRVVSVLASAATLKRKKKKAATRTSPERVNSVTKTEASIRTEDAELLGILASPQTAARKKGSFSSFKSFEANL